MYFPLSSRFVEYAQIYKVAEVSKYLVYVTGEVEVKLKAAGQTGLEFYAN